MTKRIALPILATAMGFCLVLSAAAGPFDPDEMIDLETMKPKGAWEEVNWPDTLDLSDRARIALAAGFGFQGGPQPMGLEWFHSMSYLQPIPYARTMSGSEANMDAEAAMMRVHLENLSDDGMLYWPETADEKQGTTSYQKNGFSVFTMAHLVRARQETGLAQNGPPDDDQPGARLRAGARCDGAASASDRRGPGVLPAGMHV